MLSAKIDRKTRRLPAVSSGRRRGMLLSDAGLSSAGTDQCTGGNTGPAAPAAVRGRPSPRSRRAQ